jgi:hypothetical protein
MDRTGIIGGHVPYGGIHEIDFTCGKIVGHDALGE